MAADGGPDPSIHGAPIRATPPQGRPWAAIVYVGVAALLVTFFALYTAATQVEMHGPSDTTSGRILERYSEERRGFDQMTRRFTRSYQTYTVIGERDDGSAWVVGGQEAYRFAQWASGDDVSVRTSTVTGRVVGLEEGSRTWTTHDTTTWMVGPIGLVFVSVLLAAFEVRRRRGSVAPGLTPKVLVRVGAPAGLIGAFGAVWVIFGPTWGLGVGSTAERLDGFVERPAEVEWVQVHGREVAVIERGNLAEEWAVDHDRLAEDAVVVALIGQPPRAGYRYVHLLASGELRLESIPCEPGVRHVRSGNEDVDGRLICFPPDSAADEFVIEVFRGRWEEGTWTIPLP